MNLQRVGDDPTDVVEACYQRIQVERMRDVPFLNAALRVEAVDFQPWQGQWLGALVTPWTMLLVLLPKDEHNWFSVRDNKRRFVKFPAGDFAFLGNMEPEIGEFQTCSLFAQMAQFPSQQVANATARASLLALLSPPAQNATRAVAEQPEPAYARPAVTPAPAKGDTTEKQASRRRFLFMR